MSLTLTPRAAFCEPCFCNLCEGADKLRGEPCAFCYESRWGCRNLPCWCAVTRRCDCGEESRSNSEELCWDCWTVDFHKRYDAATAVQALWRGFQARRLLAEKNAEEVRAHTPIWRFYDDQYRMYVFCQTLNVDLKKDDPEWDATKTPYYTWMMEHGPFIEECETFLRRRGWVRPKKQSVLSKTVFRRLIKGVLDSCNVTAAQSKAALAVYDTLVKQH